jgi:hypothetical protein
MFLNRHPSLNKTISLGFMKQKELTFLEKYTLLQEKPLIF